MTSLLGWRDHKAGRLVYGVRRAGFQRSWRAAWVDRMRSMGTSMLLFPIAVSLRASVITSKAGDQ